MNKNEFNFINKKDKAKIEKLIDDMMQVISKYDVVFSVSLHSDKDKHEQLVATYPCEEGLDRDESFFKIAANYLFAIKGFEFKSPSDAVKFLMASLNAREIAKDIEPILKQMAAAKSAEVKVH